MSAAVEEVRIPPPELRGAALELGRCRDLEVCLDGPAGCVAGETRLYNPVTGEHTPIKELYEKGIAPIVQTLMGAIQADVPFRKGVRNLYRVTLASGRQCIVTENHRVLTPKGWKFVSDLALGDLLGVGEPNAQPSCAHSSMHTNANSQDCCLSGYRQYGEPLLHGKDTAPGAFPSRADAQKHSLSDLHTDDRVYGLSHIPLPYTRRASKDCSHRFVHMTFAQNRGDLRSLSQSCESYLLDGQSQKRTRLALLDHEQGQYDRSTHLNGNYLTRYPRLLEHSVPAPMKRQAHRMFDGYSTSVDMFQERPNVALQTNVCSLSMSSPVLNNTTSVSYNNTLWDTVSSIEYVRTDEYFDLHVPLAHHYLAEGIWHHNTGKTYGALFKVHMLLLMYPGSKWLLARKTNTALAGSAVATYREMLDPREGVVFFGGNKIRPAAFEYPNGSVLIINGLDKRDKIKSWEFDGALVNEATECEEEDIDYVRSRLRHGKGPYHQLIMDVNPDAPEHWLNVRMNEGRTTRLLSRHEDNPRYFDAKTNDWTEEGRAYIFDVLGGLTGVLLERMRWGLWSAAHGTIYLGSWDRKRNVVDRFDIPKEWPRYLGIDFGYSNPFVCKWYAEDNDGRLYCYREIYMSQKLVEDHCKDIAITSGWFHLLPPPHEKYKSRPADWADPLPRDVIGDHDAEDRATFERHLKLFVTPAKKTVSDGIQQVHVRLRPAGDGKPRLLYFRDCLVERDQSLAKRKRPTSSIEEFNVYVWKQDASGAKEEPMKENDHGMDVDRYVIAHKDLTNHAVSVFRNVWR